MRVIRKTGLLSLLVIATLFLQNASATFNLPDSSYADGRWQGSRTFEKDGFHVLIDFAVYDTMGENEFVEAGFTAPGEGQYIYAYQLFNNLDAEKDVTYFGIFGAGGVTINESTIIGLSSQDYNEDGVAPSGEYFDDEDSRVVWEFDWGTLIASTHSYFLLFSSNSAPVIGDYEIKGEEGIPIPEPATMALLFIGGAMMISAKRRRSV